MAARQIISVVIPVYRDGARAVAAAQALLGQRLREGISLQVILVDDGSGDDTGAYAVLEVGSLRGFQGRGQDHQRGVVLLRHVTQHSLKAATT